MPTMYAVSIQDGRPVISIFYIISEDARCYRAVPDGSMSEVMILRSSPLGRRMKPTISEAKKYFRQTWRKEIGNQQLAILYAQAEIAKIEEWIKELGDAN